MPVAHKRQTVKTPERPCLRSLRPSPPVRVSARSKRQSRVFNGHALQVQVTIGDAHYQIAR
jgi:hypothetical protein